MSAQLRYYNVRDHLPLSITPIAFHFEYSHDLLWLCCASIYQFSSLVLAEGPDPETQWNFLSVRRLFEMSNKHRTS